MAASDSEGGVGGGKFAWGTCKNGNNLLFAKENGEKMEPVAVPVECGTSRCIKRRLIT